MLAYSAVVASFIADAAEQEEVFHRVSVQEVPPRPEVIQVSEVDSTPVRVVSLPFRSAVDPKTYKALKARAAAERIPSTPGVDLLKRPSESGRFAGATVSFVGLDFNSGASNGFGFFPPDTIVAKSLRPSLFVGTPDTGRVLEAANSALRLFTIEGAALQTMKLNTFFGAPVVAGSSEGILFDPKVYYDRGTCTTTATTTSCNSRFYVVALERKPSANPPTSTIWLAVSRSTNPSTLNSADWCRYALDGTWNAGTRHVSWADYPGLGVGEIALVISANQFRFSDGSFTFAIVRVLDKLTAADNDSGCPKLTVSSFQPSHKRGNARVFSLQPVQHYDGPSSFAGTAKPSYLINTRLSGRGRKEYRVWQVRNVAVPGVSPDLRLAGVRSPTTYNLPPNAPQPGSSMPLETGDSRITQAAGLGDAIWAVHGTRCNIEGGPNEACTRVVRITVGQKSSGGLVASLSQLRILGEGAGVFSYFPGIAVNKDEQVLVDFHNSSASLFLSSAWTMKEPNSTSFDSIFPITTGNCAQQDDYGRTGDYIGAQTDPFDFRGFWAAGERATMKGSDCVWETQIIKVVPSP
jgi:hypothetical protein